MEWLFSWLVDKVKGLFEWLWDRIEGMVDWLVDQFQGVFWWAFHAIADVALLLLYLIPVPGWMHADNLIALFQNIPPSVWWGLEALQVQTGAAMVLTAYTVRFLIRRVPFLG